MRKNNLFGNLTPLGLLALAACKGTIGGPLSDPLAASRGTVADGPLHNAIAFLDYDGDLTAGWVFVDSTGDYSAITKANVAFTEGVRVAALSASLDIAMTGILLGDVNDTYTGYLDVA